MLFFLFIYNTMYTFLKKMGKGKFGNIYLIKDKTKFILKIIPIHKNIKNELFILRKLKNKHNNFFLQFVKYYSSNTNHYIITTYIPNRIDLDKFIKLNEKIQFSDYVSIIKNLFIGLDYLHKLNIIHMDIKPKNILIYKINNNFNITYIDFGLSCTNKDKSCYTSRRGTSQYMDYKVINKIVKTFEDAKKTDIWSLGITIYKLIHKKLPWINKIKKEVRKEITETKYIKSKNKKFSFIIDKMLIKNYNKRYSLSELLLLL